MATQVPGFLAGQDKAEIAGGAPRLYLAGPSVFLPDAVAAGEVLKAACVRLGGHGLYPMDNVLPDGPDLARRIRDANIALIEGCDAVVADMSPFRGPAMDGGTAWEMGYGAALGRIVVGYTYDPRSFAERVAASMPVTRSADGRLRDSDGMQVEDFGIYLADNLMMSTGLDGLCPTFEAAAELAIGLVARRRAISVS